MEKTNQTELKQEFGVIVINVLFLFSQESSQTLEPEEEETLHRLPI